MRRVWQELSALFGSMGRPAIPTLFSWGCATLTYPLAAKGGYQGAVGAACIFGLSVLFLACWLGAGALAFVSDARRSCLPGSERFGRRAGLLALALLLPAFALPAAALAENPVWRVWIPTVLVLAVALAGALAPLFRPSLAGRLRAIGGRISAWEAREHAPPRAMGRNAVRAHSGPAARMVRTCLGGMFVRLSMRQRVIGAVLLALLVVAAYGAPHLGVTGRRWAVGTLTLAAAGWVSIGCLTQIARLTRAQLAELALTPGLGTAPMQRRALYGAVLLPPLLWLGLVLLLGSAALLLAGEPLVSLLVLTVCIVVICLSYTVSALSRLAALPLKRRSFLSEVLPLYFWVYWLYFELSIPRSGQWLWRMWHLFGWLSVAVGVLVGLAVASAIGVAIRRLAAAPHPFLS
jgi:hypothetical protein